MHPASLARHSTQRLRLLFAMLLLAFACNAIAHAAHRHDEGNTAQTRHLACGYCATFGTLIDAPSHGAPAVRLAIAAIQSVELAHPPLARRSHHLAQPRAPPVS